MVFLLDNDKLAFPHPEYADENGLLAIGGKLEPQWLLTAYSNGIFPWYDEEPIAWYSPDPRCVLFPPKLKVSKSMRPLLNRKAFDFTVNTAFSRVMENCSKIYREGQPGTWINEEMIAAYIKLHELGYAHSAECWLNGTLVGGLYGIKMGNVFFGESMFSAVSNASKYAFINLVKMLEIQGLQLIDCQMPTSHLMSLGAEMITGAAFREILKKEIV